MVNHPPSGGSPSNLLNLLGWSTLYLFNFFPIVCVYSVFLNFDSMATETNTKILGKLPAAGVTHPPPTYPYAVGQMSRWGDAPYGAFCIWIEGFQGIEFGCGGEHRWPGLQSPPKRSWMFRDGILGESWCSEHGLELITNLPYKWNIRVI